MKLGIALNNLGASQLNFYLARNANAAIAATRGLDVVVFFETMQRPCLPLSFASMQMPEAWGFDGVLIATSLSTVEKVVRCPSADKKIFFVWDLEWLRFPQKQYRAFRALYAHPELTLVTRGPDHARAVEEAWNVKAHVCGNFDMQRLLEVAHG